MKIIVKRSGGLAGLGEQLGAIDTDTLDPARARQVRALVEDAHFFDLPPALPSRAVGADLFRYEITASEGGRRHKVTFVDDQSPEVAPLRSLVDALGRLG